MAVDRIEIPDYASCQTALLVSDNRGQAWIGRQNSSIQIAKDNQPLTQVLNDAIKWIILPNVFRDGMDCNRPLSYATNERG